MTCPFTPEELEAHLHGLLSAARAREVEDHVARCSACRDELDWLRLEQMAFAERKEAGSPADLWNGIEERIAASTSGDETARAGQRGTVVALGRRQRAAWFGSGFAAAAMAAAVFFFYVRAPEVATPRPTAEAPTAPTDAHPAAEAAAPAAEDPAMATLESAEAEYAQAISALEAEYARRRGQLPAEVAATHERAFEDGRQLIENARQDAGTDVEARMRVLDAYSSHLRTVQAVIADLG
jgi:hypothetical protein